MTLHLVHYPSGHISLESVMNTMYSVEVDCHTKDSEHTIAIKWRAERTPQP